ncbi:MAG: ATP-binding protein [Verrucomicrobia bacterium]|nr:ATP-binding protein [Planctomycetota bacterium]MBI3878772.1 ATP-binding protein [Verrucomicrobiota bacterium]
MPDQPKRKQPLLLTGVQVAGFKSLAHRQAELIEFRPLTLLAGANSSGKSSLMQAVLLLKQTLEAGFDPGALLLDGSNVRFSSTDQMFTHLGKKKHSDSFEVELHFGDSGYVCWEFCPHESKVVEVKRAVYGKGSEKMELTPQMTSEDIIKLTPGGRGFIAFPEGEKQPEFEYTISKRRFFLGISFRPKGEEGFAGPILPHPAADQAERFLRRLIHLPGLRGNPERDYRMTAVGKFFPGTFETYTAAVIASWKASNATEKIESLNEDLLALGLTWKASANRINDTQVELVVGRLPECAHGGAHDLVNIADVGFGVSQTLPVIVALHVAEPGQCVYLEQPEIHLHPRAQVAMAGVLARAVKRGIQVIVETHSSLLLLALQALVAEGKELESQNVKLHWFDRDKKEGATFIRSGQLDEAGAYGDWPQNFGAVEMDLESRYLDAVDARQRAK